MNRMRSTWVALLLAVLMVYPTALSAAGEQGQGNSNGNNRRDAGAGLSLPVSGKEIKGGTVAGTLVIQRFVRNGSGIDAIGTLTATVTHVGGATQTFVTPVAWPVDLANSGSQPTTVIGDEGGCGDSVAAAVTTQEVCDILHLDLGPLNLDLLGLVIDLNRVILDITAVSGAGNLLGNLLCAVVGLLDGGSTVTGVLNQIAGLLNQILAILG